MTSTPHTISSAGPLSCKLPIELWDKIMQEVEGIEVRTLAKDVRVASKAHLGYKDANRDNKFLNHEVSKWRSCLRTPRSLVLVCRLWRDIFTPFLYSSMNITYWGIGNALSSHQLANILRKCPSYRHYIRRLEIWSTDSADECAFLISICDRLQILGLPKDFDWTLVTQSVSDFPAIKHLTIRRSEPVRSGLPNPFGLDLGPFPSIITFPYLQTLEVSVYSDRLLFSPACSLPSLRILKLETLDANSYPLLSRVASTLQEIKTSGPISSKDGWLAEAEPTLFPMLQKITITFQSGNVSWLPSVFPPPLPALRTLNISGSSSYLINGVKDALGIKSEYGIQWAPKLDVIRALLYGCGHAGRCTEQCFGTAGCIEWFACQDTARGLNVRLKLASLNRR